MEATMWALPGFLGVPSDWNAFQWKGVELKGIDLQAFSWNSLSEWARNFNRWVDAQAQQPAILMGYSLGGRLALHALLEQPHQWQAAIIVSAHPGFSQQQECEQRQKRDQEWAERFVKEEWQTLMQAWNGQEVFAQDTFHFKRQEHNYQRSQLARILTHGSLGKQADLKQQIATLPLPILWITGSQDERYGQLASKLTFKHVDSRWVQIEQAGHRVPWMQPQVFSHCVQDFLQKRKGKS